MSKQEPKSTQGGNSDAEHNAQHRRMLEQKCFEIVKKFSDRIVPIDVSDFRHMLFLCLHDAYIMKNAACVQEGEVTTMYYLWDILNEVEALNTIYGMKDVK